MNQFWTIYIIAGTFFIFYIMEEIKQAFVSMFEGNCEEWGYFRVTLITIVFLLTLLLFWPVFILYTIFRK